MPQSFLFNYLEDKEPENHPIQKAVEAEPDVDTDAETIFNTFFSAKENDKAEPGIETQLKCGVCGAKLIDKGIDRGCQLLVCSKRCGQGYRTWIGPPPISPCEIPEILLSTETPTPLSHQ